MPALNRQSRPACLGRLALAVALMTGSCTPTAGAGEPIIVAAVSTRGSLLQPEGGDVETGVREAVQRLNAAGGVLGRPLEVASFDDRCNRTEAEGIAAQAVALSATLVVGHLCPGAATVAAAASARAGILMIGPGVRHSRFTTPRAGPVIFRLAGRDDRLASELATAVALRFAGHRIAIAHDRSAQARGLADQIEREFKAVQLAPVLRDSYVAGEKQYNQLVDRLIAANAQIVVIPAQPIETGIILARARSLGADLTLVGSEILAVPEIEATAKAFGDHLLLMLPWMPAAKAEGAAPQADRAPVGATRLLARAAVEAWAAAAGKAQSLDSAAIGRALETETAATAIGPLRFDARGDALIPSYTLSSWRDGRWQPIVP